MRQHCSSKKRHDSESKGIAGCDDVVQGRGKMQKCESAAREDGTPIMPIIARRKKHHKLTKVRSMSQRSETTQQRGEIKGSNFPLLPIAMRQVWKGLVREGQTP